MHELNQEYLYSSVYIFRNFIEWMCTSLSESLTKSIYTLDIVGKFLSSMDRSLQQEYLYSLLNIAHAYFYSLAEGIAR